MLYQGQHTYILDQQEAKSKWITLQLMLNDTELKVAAINTNSEDGTDKTNNTLKKLEDVKGSIALKVNAIILKVFNLYHQLLSPTLRVEWDDIVDKICFATGWLDDEGAKYTFERGQTYGIR